MESNRIEARVARISADIMKFSDLNAAAARLLREVVMMGERERARTSRARHSITLRIVGDSWVADHTDPKVAEIMGTATIPTAYTAAADGRMVKREIERLNPECDVYAIIPEVKS